MKIRIKLFGEFRKYGHECEIEITSDQQVDQQVNASSLRTQLKQTLTELSPNFRDGALIDESVFADESQILTDAAIIKPGSTVALLPPVCGG